MPQLSFFDEEILGARLPCDLVEYHAGFVDTATGQRLLSHFIQTVPWKQSTRIMWGKEVLTPRLTAWFGDNVTYAHTTEGRYVTRPWTKELLALKAMVEPMCGRCFNSVLLNYYRDGNDSVAWHADDEPELGADPVIASVNFGQVRRFDIRHKQNHQQKYSVELEHGSLLVMKGNLQHNWEHRVAKSTLPMKARVNLTFRVIQ